VVRCSIVTAISAGARGVADRHWRGEGPGGMCQALGKPYGKEDREHLQRLLRKRIH